MVHQEITQRFVVAALLTGVVAAGAAMLLGSRIP